MQLITRGEVCARGLAAVLMLGAISAPVWAQAPPAIRSVTHMRIKADKVGDWMAAEKEYAALVQKVGSERSYTIWQGVTGPREYLLVRYISKYADLDVNADPKMSGEAGALAGIMARINAATEDSWREIHQMQPDLTLPRTAEMPKMIRSSRMTIAAGKTDEVLDALRSVMLPAMKTAGVTAFGVGQVRFGQSRNQWMTYVGFNSWADLDGPTPIEKAMGKDAYAKYVAKINALTTRNEWNIYRFRPELSYLPAAK